VSVCFFWILERVSLLSLLFADFRRRKIRMLFYTGSRIDTRIGWVSSKPTTKKIASQTSTHRVYRGSSPSSFS
jgi:hypothetical protein